jgi:hypothetical protein
MGITGVLLLLSGIAFAVIGIKNKWSVTVSYCVLHMPNLKQGLRLRVRCVSVGTSRHRSHRLSHEPSRLKWHPRRFLCCCILHWGNIRRCIVGLFGYHRGLWVPPWWILFEHVVSMPQVRWPYHACDWSRDLYRMHERWWLLLIL